MRKLLFILIAVFLYSCANIGTLGGGKVDEQPPKITNSNVSKTNFNSRKIILDFDEYIAPNNPEANITLQPRHSKLKFLFSRKRVVITLDSALKENTTYNLVIDKGITDNNANNPFSQTITFSTGNTVDSGTITVSIKAYKDLKNLKIALSLNDGSDSFKNFKTDYIFDVNKDVIKFNGLNDTRYNLWLYTDANLDQKPDWYKPINFIKMPERDSTYEIEPKTWNEPFIIKKAISDGKVLKIKYNRDILYAEKLDKIFKGLAPYFLYSTTDSAIISFPDPTTGISIQSITKTDVVPYINYQKEIKDMVRHSISILRIKNEYFVSFIRPQYYTEDNLKTKTEEVIIKTKKLDSFTLFPKNNKSEIPDTFYVKSLPVTDYKTLAHFNLTIKSTKGQTYDLVILKDNKDYIKAYQINQFEKYLPPGIYKIQVYQNSANYIFDPFNLSPYPVKLYEKEILLKANWEEILDIVLD